MSADVDQYLTALGIEFEVKVEAYAHVMRRMKSEAEQLAELEEYYAAKCAARKKGLDRIKSWLLAGMEAVGAKNITRPTATVWLQGTTQLEVDVGETEDPFDWPDLQRFFVDIPARRELDKSALAAAIKNKETFAHARLVTRKHVRFT